MLLRRVIEHVKTQNWTAVTLDFLIVVVGVFIGIQVSNWNDARADRALEREYLERLYADMAGAIAAYQTDVNWDEYRLEAQATALQALRSGELADDDRQDFIRALLFIGVHNPIRRQWGTVEELKSTGNIAILRDRELRDMIAKADASFERRNRIIAQSELRMAEHRAQLAQYFSPVSYGFSTFDPAEADFDFNALTADQTFINLFANADLESRMQVTFSDGYVEEIEDLRNKLAVLLNIDQDGEE